MAYDALGRLIAARWPYATVTLSTGQPQVLMTIERYYYDGIRRLQTIVGNETMENDVVSVPPGSWQTDSEYVYGPEYVDEFVLQSAPNGQAGTVTQGVPADGQRRYYMLQDANYNVMAILDESGNVWEQYQWDPYGTLAVKDTLVSSGPTNRVGHQGLFFHSFTTADRLPLNADGLYYNRNRWYSPKLGRFTSKDPNETAMDIISAMAMNGETWSILARAFRPSGHFGDGMNLYGSRGSNPLNNRDPAGLSRWDDELDDELGKLTGQKLYALGAINEGAKWAAIGLRTAVNIAASFLPGSGLYDAFKSVKVIADGKGGFWDAVNIATAALPLAKSIAGLAGARSLLRAQTLGLQACNCFVMGTPIDTPSGSVPIESVNVGDEVLTRHENDTIGYVQIGRVTKIFRNCAPAILWITLSTGEVMGTTPSHEVWTAQHGWIFAGDLRSNDAFIDRDGNLVAVIDVRLDTIPTTVCNLEVDGTFTYFAHGVWVHKNSCESCRQLLLHAHHSVAQFLGGNSKGLTIWLDETKHAEYHGGMLRWFAGAIPPVNPGNMKWSDYFRTHPGEQLRALDIMMDYTRDFDNRTGSHLLHYVWESIQSQWW